MRKDQNVANNPDIARTITISRQIISLFAELDRVLSLPQDTSGEQNESNEQASRSHIPEQQEPPLAEATLRSRRPGHILIGNRVKVTNRYSGHKNKTGTVIRITGESVVIQLDHNDKTITKRNWNVKLIT